MSEQGKRNNKITEQPKKQNYWKTRIVPKMELINGWARNGLTDAQIALNLGMSPKTFGQYKLDRVELADALEEGRHHAEVIVENALFKAATGYSYKEVTKERVRDRDTGEVEYVTTKAVLKHQPPSVQAAIYWLERRMPTKWEKNPGSPTDAEAIMAGMRSLADLLLNPVKERERDEN